MTETKQDQNDEPKLQIWNWILGQCDRMGPGDSLKLMLLVNNSILSLDFAKKYDVWLLY